MSDLISRKALLEALRLDLLIKGELNYDEVKDLITNAPAVERGEPVAWQGLGICTFEKPTTNSHLFSPLYTIPQQPQSVADALEEAALIAEKICFGRQTTDDAGSSRWLEAGKCGRQTAEAIRALIKRNAVKEGEVAVDALEELERALCVIGVVGNVDGHDVIRRDSVINVARQRIKAQK